MAFYLNQTKIDGFQYLVLKIVVTYFSSMLSNLHTALAELNASFFWTVKP